MAVILADEYLVVQGTDYNGNPVFFDCNCNYYSIPTSEIAYLDDIPRDIQEVKQLLEKVKEECPEEFKPFIAKVNLYYKTTKWKQKK